MPPSAATVAGRATSTRNQDHLPALAPDDFRVIDTREPHRARRAAPAPPRPARAATPAPPATRRQRPVERTRPRDPAADAAYAPLTFDAPARPVQKPRRPQTAPQRRARPQRVREPERARRSLASALPKPRVPRGALRIDRIVRGRAWIPVLGVLLVAVVAMRVEVLKMGTHMGVYVQQETQLQATNQGLKAKVAELSGSGRIERLAAEKLGMVQPGPGSITFLSAASGRDVARAASAIKAPSNVAFEQNLAVAQGQTVSTSSPAGSVSDVQTAYQTGATGNQTG